jgi:hypothetical protein
MIFQLSNCILDIDVKRTREFYERSDVLTMSERCDCLWCQNFDKAILESSGAVMSFLHCLGIDPQKPAETFNVTGMREKDGTVWYNGWYHVCGEIKEGPDTMCVAEEKNGARIVTYCWEKGYAPDPNFSFRVLPVLEKELLHKDFPKLVVQLEFDTHLPFVLTDIDAENGREEK